MDEETEIVLMTLIIGMVVFGMMGMIYLEDKYESPLETCQGDCRGFHNSDADLQLECLLGCQEKFECSDFGSKN